MDVLGKEITSIAREKAGIIKRGVPVVTGADGEALEVIEGIARALGSEAFVLGRDFSYRRLADRTFDYYGVGRTIEGVEIGLEGDHQIFNASLALCTLELLERAGFSASEERLREGLRRTRWEGRLETMRERPLVIADGAHNMGGIRSLLRYLSRFEGRRKVLVFGVLRDKEYEAMLKELKESFDLIVLTRPKAERAVEPSLLVGVAPEKSIVEEDLGSALRRALREAKDEDVVVITGSLYTVGEAKALMDERS
jgi:dihydrofolate synthase/folylpolyglutamate synthase